MSYNVKLTNAEISDILRKISFLLELDIDNDDNKANSNFKKEHMSEQLIKLITFLKVLHLFMRKEGLMDYYKSLLLVKQSPQK